MWRTPGSRTGQPSVLPFAVVLLAPLLMHAIPVAATPSSTSATGSATMPQTGTPTELCSSEQQPTCGATQSPPAPAPAFTPSPADPAAPAPAPASAPSAESETASEGSSRASQLQEEGDPLQGITQRPQPLPAGDEAGNTARAQALLAQGAAEAKQGNGLGPAPDAVIPETRPPRDLGPVVQPKGL